MKEKEERLKYEKQEELELLQIRHAADELFRQNEAEKAAQRRENAEVLRNFLVDQYVSALSHIMPCHKNKALVTFHTHKKMNLLTNNVDQNVCSKRH